MKRLIKKSAGAFLALTIVLSIIAGVNTSAVDSSKTASGDSNTYTKASQELDNRYGYDKDDLGATYTPNGTTFKVWAPTATDVKVNLYTTGSDRETGAQKLSTTALDYNSSTGIWSKTLNGDYKNKYYTYTITAKNVTGTKITTKETQDIYSVATGVNGQRSQIVDLDSTDPEGWNNDAHVLLDKQSDSFVWEVHVKDFSYDTKSGVSDKTRGKFLAFTETGTTLENDGQTPTMIDYLKNLGVTTVQITPFYDFNKDSVDETGPDSQFNWGYDPVNYNVPDGSYSTNPYDGNVRIKECKQMIQALHNAGISVVMDVVYNHTFSAPESSFEACVPNYYYRMKADGTYSDGSGCGNETASERRMYRNFMIQSCLYWVNEYHIDGFRFDLMAIHDVETMNLLRNAMDKVDPRITLWGEGWTGGSCNYPSTTCTGETFRAANQGNASYLSERVAYFNDGIRDALKGSVFDLKGKGWVQGASSSLANLNYGILANTTTEGTGRWTARQPSQTVTYASCHDNQTLWDRLACSQGITDFRSRNETLAAQNKLVGGFLNMSQGVTFMLAGEEMGRSKDNDENSYKSSATLNMIDWSNAKTNSDIVNYYKGMREIREHFSPLRDNTNNSSASYKTSSGSKTVLDASKVNAGNVNWFAWTWTTESDGRWVAGHGTNSSDITFDGVNNDLIFVALDPSKCNNGANPTWDAKIAQTGNLTLGGSKFTVTSISGESIRGNWSGSAGGGSTPSNIYAGIWTNNTSGEWKKLAVIANNSSSPAEYTIDSSEGTDWVIIADSKSAGVKNLGTVMNGKVTLGAYSMVVAVDKESFDNVDIKPTIPTTSPTSTQMTTAPTSTQPSSATESSSTETITTAPSYELGDVNRDGHLNILDVTLIQKKVAYIITFDEQQQKLADVNNDSYISIKDATKIQHIIAKMSS